MFCFTEWSEWSGCEANCMRTKTRNCQGGDECTQSRSLEEPCDDGLCNQGTFPCHWFFTANLKLGNLYISFYFSINCFSILFAIVDSNGLFSLIHFNQISQLTIYGLYTHIMHQKQFYLLLQFLEFLPPLVLKAPYPQNNQHHSTMNK